MEIFTFGKVEGKGMPDTINAENVTATQSGLAYLCYIYHMTEKQYIKEEIETCLKKYSCNYILRFGMYAGKTLAEIDSENSTYITGYLLNNKNEEIRTVVQYYLSYCRNKDIRQYNQHQEQTYLKYKEMREQVNKSTGKDIELVLNYLGINTKNKSLERCPWGCEKSSSRYEHAYIFQGSNNSWLIRCCKCTHAQNFIKFVSERKNVTENVALDWISSILGIVANIPTNNYQLIKKTQVIEQNSIELHSLELQEVNLNNFAFTQEYPQYFYDRGFSNQNGNQMKVYYQKNFDKSGFWKRICFPTYDLQNRCVGVVGRNTIEEKEHYQYWSSRLCINTELPIDQQIELIKKKGKKYIKYFNNFKTAYILYNANMLVNSKKDEVFVCEGPFDVLKMVCKHGYQNTVGMYKNSIGPGQLYQFYQLYKDVRDSVKIYLVTDGDEAGLNGFKSNVQKLQEIGFKNIYKMSIIGAKDACEATKEQVDQAYSDAQLQNVEFKKKQIVLLDVATQQTELLEE